MKKAFTMIELVFVVVVMGILAATIIPNTRTNPLQEAAVQVLSDIRYTQHLAMVDDKNDITRLDSITGLTKWYKERWQILFSSNGGSGGEMGYTVFSDSAGDSTGNPDEAEIALNPGNPNQRMTGGYNGANTKLDIDDANFVGMDRLNIGKQYNIANVAFSASCNGGGPSTRIAFDHLGRPLQGNRSSNLQSLDNNDLIQADCNIVLTDNEGDIITIKIEEETGFACILDGANCII